MVLRLVVLAAGAALLLVGASVPSWSMALLGGAIVVGTLAERVFYKPLLPRHPGPGWQRTGERFVDPDGGKLVEVYYNPISGERQYVQREG